MIQEAKELKNIGEKLKKLRIKKGYTSYERFAIEFELSRMQYWRIEEGRTNITFRSLIAILNIHKISIEKFFSDNYLD
jgi:transcriptional regulator with XRE-family HTH domain